jgi:apolipoprotein N-acyltransferase
MSIKSYQSFTKKHELVILLICGFILLGTAFQIHILGLLVVPVMALMWSLFQHWEEAYFTRKVALTSTMFNGIVWSWLLAITPSGWTTIDGSLARAMMIATWVGITIVSSLAFFIFAKTWVYFNKRIKLDGYRSIVLFTSLWILQEFIRSYLLSVAFAGEGYSLGAHWNYGVLGIALTSFPVSLSLASTIGMYGLSSVVVLAGVTIYELSTKRVPKKLILLLIAAHIIAPAYNMLINQSKNTEIRVGALNSATSDIRYSSSSFSDEQQVVDLLVLPEYSEVFGEKTKYSLSSDSSVFISQNTKNDSIIITSVSTKEDGEISKNKVTAYTPKGDVLAQHDKQFLIPGGEFLPLILKLPLNLTKSEKIIDTYNKTLRVLPSDKPEEPIIADFGSVGALACSGIMSPQLYRSLAQKDARILTNSASLTLVKGSEVFHQKMIGFGKFNAAANQKPFVQSSKLGKSFILDKNGKMLAGTNSAVNSYITADVAINNSTTIFTRWGEVILYASFIFLLHSSINSIRKR